MSLQTTTIQNQSILKIEDSVYYLRLNVTKMLFLLRITAKEMVFCGLFIHVWPVRDQHDQIIRGFQNMGQRIGRLPLLSMNVRSRKAGGLNSD